MLVGRVMIAQRPLVPQNRDAIGLGEDVIGRDPSDDQSDAAIPIATDDSGR
jgi:hypothetical protein